MLKQQCLKDTTDRMTPVMLGILNMRKQRRTRWFLEKGDRSGRVKCCRWCYCSFRLIQSSNSPISVTRIRRNVFGVNVCAKCLSEQMVFRGAQNKMIEKQSKRLYFKVTVNTYMYMYKYMFICFCRISNMDGWVRACVPRFYGRPTENVYR